MTSLSRIKLIYICLKKKPYSLESLLKDLKKNNFIISKRQLQRDIANLSIILKKGEVLTKSRNKANKLELKINNTIIEQEAKLIIADSDSIDTLFSKKIKATTKKSLEQMTLNKDLIKIKLSNTDYTSDNIDFETKSILFLPIKKINHKNNLYIGGYNLKLNELQIFEYSQIKSIELVNKMHSLDLKKINTTFDIELKKRFGVSRNINNKTYIIKLEFSYPTGNYIKNRKWHHSQKFKDSGTSIIMTLECGINRELLSWIFSWMYNVKILEPVILKNYYHKTLTEIKKSNASPTMVYKNVF